MKTTERPEFDALVKVGLALALQLKEKLILWGKQMQEKSNEN